MTDVGILESVRTHWRDLRGRTYDLTDAIGDADLKARLPFAESQDVLYQLRCMLGSQENWTPVLLEGRMCGWARSLDHEAHHHGQLINLIYACSFPIPIPESWTDAWGISRG